jgi:hypothetical protein
MLDPADMGHAVKSREVRLQGRIRRRVVDRARRVAEMDPVVALEPGDAYLPVHAVSLDPSHVRRAGDGCDVRCECVVVAVEVDRRAPRTLGEPFDPDLVVRAVGLRPRDVRDSADRGEARPPREPARLLQDGAVRAHVLPRGSGCIQPGRPQHLVAAVDVAPSHPRRAADVGDRRRGGVLRR